MTPSAKRRLSVALIVLLAAAALVRALWPDDENAGKKPQSVPVRVTQAIAQDYPLTFTTMGRVQPSETVTLRARVDGQVEQVLMQEGRPVKAGDVLIRLDAAELKARLTQAEATLARDEAQLANARTEFDRNEKLKEKNYVSDDMLRASRTNVASLSAAVKSARAAVENARLQLSYSVVRAPFEGRIGARLVSPGTAVRVNDTVLAVINRVRPVQVAFAVPEKFLGQLQPLREGRRMPVLITADNDAALRAEGFADFIDNTVDPASGTIQVKATFPNRDDRLTPGALVRVSLALDTLKGAITIPVAALQQDGEKATVYVIDAEQKARLRPVQVSDQRSDIAAIAAGLTAGERVVVDGHLRLTPGATVKVQGAQP
ncbi:MAG: efflux transporter, family, subunit [Moraxellaceae bacterium]|jgi:multidrug efflux system membrane fusion protein|nr:efflux transporter, family, subunit [Moraxellaceae bacterium]